MLDLIGATCGIDLITPAQWCRNSISRDHDVNASGEYIRIVASYIRYISGRAQLYVKSMCDAHVNQA